MTSKDNFKRGNIEMLILYLLQEKEMYGYQISQTLMQRSQGLFVIQEGTMYPTLYRMLDRGLIADRVELLGRRKTRVYYRIQPEGEAYLKQLQEEYEQINKGIKYVIDSRCETAEDSENKEN